MQISISDYDGDMEGDRERFYISRLILHLLTSFFFIQWWFGVAHLTHISQASHKRDLCKQCRPRSDAAERGVWSGSTLFALRMGISLISNNTKRNRTPLKLEMGLSKEIWKKSSFGINGLNSETLDHRPRSLLGDWIRFIDFRPFGQRRQPLYFVFLHTDALLKWGPLEKENMCSFSEGIHEWIGEGASRTFRFCNKKLISSIYQFPCCSHVF